LVINVAARIASYSGGGQVLCSSSVIERMGDVEGVRFKEVGTAKFKNVKKKIELFEVYSDSRKDIITAIDTVCRMKVDKNNSQANMQYEGKTYYFCSLECAWEFMHEPEEYSYS